MSNVTVSIGSETRDLSDASESWINEQISRRRADGEKICVRVTIRTGGLDLVFTTPGCGSGGGGGRQANPNEQEVIGLWQSRGLNSFDFAGGNLVAFLKQLRKFLG